MGRPKSKASPDKVVSVRLAADQVARFEAVAAYLIGFSDHEKWQSLIELALRTARRDSMLDRSGHVICTGPFANTTDLIIRSDRADDIPRMHELIELWELERGH
jgi:hypothetical protein